MRNHILIFVFSLLPYLGYAEGYRKEIIIRFPQSIDTVQPTFADNKAKLNEILQTIKTIQNDSTLEFVDVVFTGYASPEGTTQFNKTLSQGRAKVLEDYVNSHITLPARVNIVRSIGNMWNELDKLVDASDFPYRAMVTQVIRNTPELTYANGKLVGSRRKALMDLDGGIIWNKMLEDIFPQLRFASVTFVADREIIPEPEPEPEVVPEPEPEPIIVEEVVEEPAPVVEEPQRKCYWSLHTNMLYDIALIPNLGAEFSLGKHLSIAGNWWYAWWDRDAKHYYWRTYGGYLAGRYWFGKKAKAKPLTGHHAGIYGQVMLYDFEWGGTGYLSGAPHKTITYKPTWGGGLEYGYAAPVGRRLNIDITCGVGYMQGQYMKYDPQDGHYVWKSTHMRHWIGPTKLEVSLVWLLGAGNVNSKQHQEKGGEE